MGHLDISDVGYVLPDGRPLLAKELVLTLKTTAAFNDGLASRYSAAQTRLRTFEEAGPPQAWPASRTSGSG